jgi:hypothetical protein
MLLLNVGENMQRPDTYDIQRRLYLRVKVLRFEWTQGAEDEAERTERATT